MDSRAGKTPSRRGGSVEGGRTSIMQGTVTFLAGMAHQGDYIRWKLPLIVVPSRASHTPTEHEGVRNATTVGVRNVMTRHNAVFRKREVTSSGGLVCLIFSMVSVL